MKESLKDAIYAHRISKVGQSARSSLTYKPHCYKEGNKLWISKTLFKDAKAKSQDSDKLTLKRFGTYTLKHLVGRNAVDFEQPSRLRVHNVINVMHTMPYFGQPDEISVEVPNKPNPVHADTGEKYVVEAILKHRMRRDRFQFLSLMKGDPTN